MKKKLFILVLLVLSIFSLSACKDKEVVETIEAESTLIETNKKVSDFKDDYNSILYAYLNNYYNKINSVQIDIEGTLKAKVSFINYEATFSSTSIKRQDAIYKASHSHSTFMDFDSYSYETKDVVIESKDQKRFDVYSQEDYAKVNYSEFLPLLYGIVCTDETIASAKLISNKDGIYTIKYVFDANLASPYLQRAIKYNGSLKENPEFVTLSVEVTMKEDYTPVSVYAEMSYNASKPLLGSGLVTQTSLINYSHVNETLTIENEAHYIELSGQTPTEVREEDDVTSSLLESLSNIKPNDGLAIEGLITSELMLAMGLNLEANTKIELKSNLEDIKDDLVYNFANLYFEFDADENLSTLLGLVSSFAGEKFKDYEDLLSELDLLKVYYLGDGNVYLEAKNASGVVYYVSSFKLTDAIDALVKDIKLADIDDLIRNDSQLKFADLEKETIDENSYKINVILSEDYIAKISNALDKFFTEQEYVQMIVGYTGFDKADISITVTNANITCLSCKLTYKAGEEVLRSLLDLTLTLKPFSHDFSQDEAIFASLKNYNNAMAIKEKIDALVNEFHLDYICKDKANDALAEYEELDENGKNIVGVNAQTLANKLEHIDEDIEYLYVIANGINKLSMASNQEIYELCYAYNHAYNKYDIQKAIGETLANRYSNISDYVDYLGCMTDFAGVDTTTSVDAWGLSDEQIMNYKILFSICEENSGVASNAMLYMLMGGVSYFEIAPKILAYSK